ncbi:MAG: radical SAM family heme chaperone HemW [Gammaproteobacteria bacterium]|nr:radical SAM family heme chaperone HemW [Gammaproteobacteria bacterium]
MADRKQALPLSLYVHTPWCVRKCPYCDFNSHELRRELQSTLYVQALLRDLDYALMTTAPRPLQSIFIGGGTPSLLPAAAYAELLGGIAKRLPLAAGIEITMEANPGTVEADRFRGYRDAGINRLSLGIQSFDDRQLQRLGRIHDSAQARRAVETADAAGFDSINLDLMFGLPGQLQDEALADLETAVAFDPAHLSWYQLTIEPNTVFYKQPPVLPDDEVIWPMQQAGQALLSCHGYRQYEVSAYARPGKRCRHNLNYWRFGDYLGIGAGAHSKLTDPATNVIRRQARHRIPETYMQHAGTSRAIGENRVLAEADKVFEFMLNVLRLSDGVPLSLLQQHTGISPVAIHETLQQGRRKKLLRDSERRLQPTARGRRFLNDLIGLFLPDQEPVPVAGMTML